MAVEVTHGVIWHQLECHGYQADLELWRELAVPPVLDVGAGTGRVALDLASRGHEVTALDRESGLLAELERRAASSGVTGRIETACADAQAFDLGRRFATVIAPMQTVQLLADRPGFLRCARAHLRAGGLLAVAIVSELEPFDGSVLPPPDVGRFDGWGYSSQAVAIRPTPGAMRIERLRSAWGPGGERLLELDATDLAALDAPTLEAEAETAGLRPAGRRAVARTDDHVGSEVVLLRA